MMKFAIGLIVGLLLGSSMAAFASGIYGRGSLDGWTVTQNGDEICSDPDVDVSGREIVCD